MEKQVDRRKFLAVVTLLACVAIVGVTAWRSRREPNVASAAAVALAASKAAMIQDAMHPATPDEIRSAASDVKTVEEAAANQPRRKSAREL